MRKIFAGGLNIQRAGIKDGGGGMIWQSGLDTVASEEAKVAR